MIIDFSKALTLVQENFIIDKYHKIIDNQFKSDRIENQVEAVANAEGLNNAVGEIIKQLTNYLQSGSIDFMDINLEDVERQLRESVSNLSL